MVDAAIHTLALIALTGLPKETVRGTMPIPMFQISTGRTCITAQKNCLGLF